MCGARRHGITDSRTLVGGDGGSLAGRLTFSTRYVHMNDTTLSAVSIVQVGLYSVYRTDESSTTSGKDAVIIPQQY